MPGPVVYVAVAISAVAAALVFKEVGRSLHHSCRSAHRVAVSSSMILIYVQRGPPGGRGAEGDRTCIRPHHRQPHHRRAHLEVMVRTG